MAVGELLELTEIAHLRDRRPGELSGGQKQRVALCRALVQDASVYVLDEPISHLDAKLRNQLRGAIRRRQTHKPVPTIWTSPDAMEALSIADRIAVLSAGRIQQFATADEIYNRPATTEVARLVGDPAMNLIDGQLRAEGSGLVFERQDFKLRLPKSLMRKAETNAKSREVVLGLRPNGLNILDGGQAKGDLSVRVYAWEPFGKYAIVTAELGPDLVRIKTPKPDRYEIDATIAAKIDAGAIVLFDKKNGAAI
jgi:ABC-type sugar transport system ATPase subunit